MKLSETSYDNRETGCCARFDPRAWSEGEVQWRDVPFVHERVRTFMHVPLNFGGAITRANAAIEAASAYPQDPLTLSRHVSPWRTDLYLMVDRAVPGAEVERLSGTFRTKIVEGPYRHAGTWEREFREEARAEGRPIGDVFSYYTTCPKCAKHFGRNYTVLFGKVSAAEPGRATP